MKAKVSLKMFVLSAALLIASFTASARNNDGQLIYNPIEENGMTVENLSKPMQSMYRIWISNRRIEWTIVIFLIKSMRWI